MYVGGRTGVPSWAVEWKQECKGLLHTCSLDCMSSSYRSLKVLLTLLMSVPRLDTKRDEPTISVLASTTPAIATQTHTASRVLDLIVAILIVVVKLYVLIVISRARRGDGKLMWMPRDCFSKVPHSLIRE